VSAAPDLVPDSYVDASRIRRRIDPEVRAAVSAAMGLDEPPPDPDPVAVVRRGGGLPVPGELTLEDGTALGRVAAIPPDAPHGYHRLLDDSGAERLVITGPGRCHLPEALRAWGWAIQLAATRSRGSWGIGDLADLRELARRSASVGAGFVAVGPMSAPNPGPDPEPSPYFPSTRRFGNPLYLRPEEVPGVADDGSAEHARALNGERRIDRAEVQRLKRAVLERAWSAGGDRRTFDAWRVEQGAPLERWAAFSVLAERHGPAWRSWPEPLPQPGAHAVARAAADESDRIGFHAWLQWCFDRQLAAASEPLRRVADMPVGVHPSGFDAWDWQDQLATGASIGVPPDRFNTSGQDWGMPPFVPHRLRAAGYRPFIETVRAQLRHAGGLRIDHVLGLFRLWCVPAGADPARGAYVRQPTDELLEIVAIESERAGAVVIGEDLGTVPPGVRAELRRRRLLSTRLALFERRPPSGWPRRAFAAVSTHDLPTIAGLWSGADLRDQAASGVTPAPLEAARLRRRLLKAAGLRTDADAGQVGLALHRRLAAAPAMLMAATLEDALDVAERPNLPGTVPPQRDNWSLALPVSIEELGAHRGVAKLVKALRR
jgi:4-alpha-glucanotransferase